MIFELGNLDYFIQLKQYFQIYNVTWVINVQNHIILAKKVLVLK